jgi:hypothetical protein
MRAAGGIGFDAPWRDARQAVRSLRRPSPLLAMTVGIAIGLISAWGLAELVRGFLFEVQPRDPLVFAGASLILALAGLIAAFGPARRVVGRPYPGAQD